MKHNLINIFTFIVLVSLCSGQKVPSWYADGTLKGYSSQQYFIGLGEGKDSAALAKFLITEESSWVTGQVIAVDGGRSKLS